MTILDFILIFILAFTTCLGFFFGLIRVVGAIFTIIVSILLAGFFFSQLAVVLLPYLLDNQNLARVVAFIIIYSTSSVVLSLAVKIADKIFHLPILNAANRLLGGIVALAGTALTLSVLFFLIDKFAWVEAVKIFLSHSVVVKYLLIIGKYVSLAIPGI
jgi:uncharacterized membrane protein required for colicin V production